MRMKLKELKSNLFMRFSCIAFIVRSDPHYQADISSIKSTVFKNVLIEEYFIFWIENAAVF